MRNVAAMGLGQSVVAHYTCDDHERFPAAEAAEAAQTSGTESLDSSRHAVCL